MSSDVHRDAARALLELAELTGEPVEQWIRDIAAEEGPPTPTRRQIAAAHALAGLRRRRGAPIDARTQAIIDAHPQDDA